MVEQIRELPELNEALKSLLKVAPKKSKPKKEQKKTIKGEFSSSSEDEDKFQKYNFASKV